MTLHDFEKLLTTHGQEILARAEAMIDHDTLSMITILRKKYPDTAALITASVETAQLRLKAQDKFTNASKLYFTRESLEQSTNEVVANYRVKRFSSYQKILDVGCGIGGDAMAFAKSGHQVVGLELDPLRAAMARENLNLVSDNFKIIPGDFESEKLPLCDAIFCDPARRQNGKRILSPEESSPRPSDVIRRFSKMPMAFKLAPGIHREEAHQYGGEVEFISLNRELKECVVWMNSLKSTETRATCLINNQCHTMSGDRSRFCDLGSICEFLYDPDPAIVRANLTAELANQLGLHALDSGVATLTGPRITSPLITAFQVIDQVDLDIKKVKSRLRDLNAGHITIIKRGVDVDADALMKKWRCDGDHHLTVFLTPIDGKPRVILCQNVS